MGRGNSRANTFAQTDFVEMLCLLDTELTQAPLGFLVIHNNRTDRMVSSGGEPLTCPSYQLLTVGYWPTVAMAGSRGLGIDPGEELENR